ncbi:uncharacterized protein PGTG_20569 [Puccinia graminis f. sp. tritici CRL 75-36-700-3]|uniref:Uncharacterized protein n=1 Tax=Puccinia graminis f. sp. tritici (strain CRL 75-36-700-3 / race SCCL) TaxID=418459 RepID=H6QNX3_PUCGT|nr:uncharacterized protein PGTG_20569 [Puccinia graminis f. sp. tritici CRL 75-36-700-3]EHS62443.1 hypothetical protein PGTG_20569 [Puccinia graminis f. sp. tritici CRL 75-36-700-3]
MSQAETRERANKAALSFHVTVEMMSQHARCEVHVGGISGSRHPVTFRTYRFSTTMPSKLELIHLDYEIWLLRVPAKTSNPAAKVVPHWALVFPERDIPSLTEDLPESDFGRFQEIIFSHLGKTRDDIPLEPVLRELERARRGKETQLARHHQARRSRVKGGIVQSSSGLWQI